MQSTLLSGEVEVDIILLEWKQKIPYSFPISEQITQLQNIPRNL